MLPGVFSIGSWSEDSTTGKAEGGHAELRRIRGRPASPMRGGRPVGAPRVGISRIHRWPIVGPGAVLTPARASQRVPREDRATEKIADREPLRHPQPLKVDASRETSRTLREKS